MVTAKLTLGDLTDLSSSTSSTTDSDKKGSDKTFSGVD
tara:strand:+ start:152 stop:265 length:114 start_codon:yes stop_codon:yes gene_type:complete